MALGDIIILQQASAGGGPGSRNVYVAPSAGVISAGEPVFLIAGATSVIVNSGTNLITAPSPFVPFSVSGTGLLGIAETTSNNTSTASGSVNYVPADSSTTYLVTANSAYQVSTQALYDANVGKRVLLSYASGAYTLISQTDSALNGFVVLPLDVAKYPGKVAFRVTEAITAE